MTMTRSSHYAGIGSRAVARRNFIATSSVPMEHAPDDWLAAATRQSGIDLGVVAPETWLALGESYSKCAHFIHSPLLPEWFEDLTHRQVHEAIEALRLLDEREGTPSTSPATGTARRSTGGIAGELHELARERVHRRSMGVTVHGLHTLHVRCHGATALSGPAIDDLRAICERWNGPAWRHPEPPVNFALGFIRAVAVHHELLQRQPFGPSSAATARMAEIGAMLELDEISIRQAGLLGVHYAATIEEYERSRLARTTAIEFIDYAAMGFRDAVGRQMFESRSFFPDRRAELYRQNATGQPR